MTTRELEQILLQQPVSRCIDLRADASAGTFGQANASLSISCCKLPKRTVPAWNLIWRP